MRFISKDKIATAQINDKLLIALAKTSVFKTVIHQAMTVTEILGNDG